MDHSEFVDYYEILQVNPTCDRNIIDSAYRYLAKQYHPDHAETADSALFQLIIDAHNTLKNPKKRAEYDIIHRSRMESKLFSQKQGIDSSLDARMAISDAEIQKNILFMLYKKRRSDAKEPGIIAFYIQEAFGCSDDTFEFHIWYLKSKGLVVVTEQGMLAITIEGVEYVISMHQHRSSEKLMIAQANEKDDEPQ